MIADPGSPDPGLVVMGGSGQDNLTISGGGSSYRVSGSALQPGAACDQVSGGDVVCTPLARWAMSSPGAMEVPTGSPRAGFPPPCWSNSTAAPAMISSRGAGVRICWRQERAAPTGSWAAGGDDALVSRGHGSDRLFGGRGNDQLVTDSPCAGHLFSGGSGKADVAGFGHVQHHGVKARIGGKGRLRRGGRCDPTRIRGDNEVLEGSRFADVLIASGGGDLLIGREGNDRRRRRTAQALLSALAL